MTQTYSRGAELLHAFASNPRVPLKRALLAVGVVAPLMYLIAVGASAWQHAASESSSALIHRLAERQAPEEPLLGALFVLAHVGLLAAAVIFWLLAHGAQSRTVRAGGEAWMVAAVLGLGVVIVPLERIGATETAAEILRGAMGSVVVGLSVAAMALLAVGARRTGRVRFSAASWTIFALMCAAIVGGVEASNGLIGWEAPAELVMIGGYLVWSVLTAAAFTGKRRPPASFDSQPYLDGQSRAPAAHPSRLEAEPIPPTLTADSEEPAPAARV